MGIATITIEDVFALDPDKPAPFNMEVIFSDGDYDESSKAHRIIQQLANAVLKDAQRAGLGVSDETPAAPESEAE